jgi:hypothetical protein
MLNGVTGGGAVAQLRPTISRYRLSDIGTNPGRAGQISPNKGDPASGQNGTKGQCARSAKMQTDASHFDGPGDPAPFSGSQHYVDPFRRPREPAA